MLAQPWPSPPSTRWLHRLSVLFFCLLIYASLTIGMTTHGSGITKRRMDSGTQHIFAEAQTNDHDDSIRTATKDLPYASAKLMHGDALPAMINALDVMQDQFFEVWQGVWPTGIDWTSAVLGTLVSGSLSSISTSLDFLLEHNTNATIEMNEKAHENLVNRYFS